MSDILKCSLTLTRKTITICFQDNRRYENRDYYKYIMNGCSLFDDDPFINFTSADV